MPSLSERQAAIVAEAESWLSTPYHHAACVKGVGVDCAMLPVRVFGDLGLLPPIDPRPYPHDWMLHRDDERYLGWVERYADPVNTPAPGDLVLFRVGRCLAHGGIVIGPDLMIHADLHAGCVERCEISRWADRLGGYWRLRSE
jgi:NlpC/P60 family putative phage cell wall peptidase